jgi:cytochrome P450/2-polyprenyl-3-methyl-5-hydroxy-6-metoxy-1,4-benzoquinol methylase
MPSRPWGGHPVLEGYNPFDPDLIPRLTDVVKALHDDAPAAFFVETLGIWVITDPDAVESIARDRATTVRFREQLIKQRGPDALEDPFARAWMRVVLTRDGEDHRRIRSTFVRHLTQWRVDTLREASLSRANRLVDGFIDEGEVDLIPAFLIPVVHGTISTLLGVNEDEARSLYHWSQAIRENEQAIRVSETSLEKGRAAFLALDAFFGTKVSERREHPGDDLLSVMVAECDAGNLSEDELIANTWALFLGGLETTASMIALSLAALEANPGQRVLLMSQPLEGGSGVEELIRFAVVAAGAVRFIGQPVRVGDVEIPAESCVYLSWASHNWDPDRWPVPLRLDVTREPGMTMTFGHGPHACTGRALAKSTLCIALELLYGRGDQTAGRARHAGGRGQFALAFGRVTTFRTTDWPGAEEAARDVGWHDAFVNDEAARLVEAQKKYYDLRAPDYMDLAKPSDRPGRSFLRDDEARAMIDELCPEGAVLELACGPGAFTRHLVRHAESVTAVDASPRMLERNEREVADSGVRYIEADVLSWTPDRTYDVVFFANWLSHVPDSVFPSFFSMVGAALRSECRMAFIDEDDRHPELDDTVTIGDVPAARRTLADGRQFDIVKVFRNPEELEAQLRDLGWDVHVRRVSEAYLFGSGTPLR